MLSGKERERVGQIMAIQIEIVLIAGVVAIGLIV
jgi:hypothetical protein